MNRQHWKFIYPCAEILDGAAKKLAYHTQRWHWWTMKKDEILATIKEKGIVIDESAAANNSIHSFSNSTYAQPHAHIDEKLQKHLQESLSKIAEHRGKVMDYYSWTKVLQKQVGTVELHYDDWLHFFDVTLEEQEDKEDKTEDWTKEEEEVV